MRNNIYILVLITLLIQGCDITSPSIDEVDDIIDKPTITITFDDGTKTQSETAHPILRKYDLTATTYVVTDLIGTSSYYSNNNEIQGLINSDWEIGTHTLRHDDMTQLSMDSVIINLEEPKEYLIENFGITPQSYTSPFGLFNNEIINEVEPRYTTHVNAYSEMGGINNVRLLNPMNIHRLDINQGVSSHEVCQTISQLSENDWFVLLFHNIRTPEVGYWDNSIEKFERIIKCIGESDVDVRNITQMYELIKEQFPNSIESVNENYDIYNTLPETIHGKHRH